jgi:predicted amidophosphoribosyltransferase
MKCKSCKMEIPNDWNACPNCGTPIGQKAPGQATPPAQPYKKIVNILLIAGIGLYLLYKLLS